MRCPSLIALLLAAAPASAQAVPDSLAFARQITEWFLHGQMDSVFAHVHPEGREGMNVEFLRGRLAQLQQRAGAELRVVEERFVRRNGQTQYWRAAWWSDFADETITLRFVLVEGFLAGMGVNPTSQNPPIDP